MSEGKTREPLTKEERAKFEGYASEMFSRMGLDLNSPGVRELSSRTGTLVMRGAYNENPLLSQEFRLMVDRRSASPSIAA